MKRFFVILTALCLAGNPLFGQLGGAGDESRPVALVKLTKSQPISVSEFKAFVNRMGGPSVVNAENRRKILETMSNQLLICQAAESEKVSVTDNDVNKAFDEQLQQLTEGLKQQNGKAPSAAEIDAEIAKAGTSRAALKEEIRRTLLIQRYLLAKKGAMIQGIKQTSDSEVKKLYDQTPKDKTFFEGGLILPARVVFNAIVVRTVDPQTGAQLDKTKKLNRANQLVKQIGGDAGKFDDAMSSVNASSDYAGLKGITVYKDPIFQAQLGLEFYNTAFRLKQGEVSQLLDGNNGYYIIKVVETPSQKVLGLDDPLPDDLKAIPEVTALLMSVGIDPRAQITIKHYITIIDTMKRQQETMAKAQQELLDETRKRGGKDAIQIIDSVYNNIIW